MSNRALNTASRATLVCAAVIVWVGVMLVGPVPTRAQETGDTTLAFFTPVRGDLNDATPLEQYTFEGFRGQVISVIVVTLSGDLDPVVQVIGPDGAIAGENDDIDSLVRDAGLEAFALPETGTYTIRVMRYDGVNGTTSGTYEMTLTPGLGQLEWREPFDAGALSWVTPAGEALPLSGGGLRLRVNDPGTALRALPPQTPAYENVYVQADARLFGIVPYAEFGLVVRAQGADFSRSYVVKFNTNAQWSVLLTGDSSEFVLRSWSANAALRADSWRMGVLVRGDRLDVFANDTHLGTVTDARLSGAGTVGLYLASAPDEDEDISVIFDDVLVTTRLGTTYSGLPLTLASWDSPDPDAIIAELLESGQIANPAISYDLFLPEKSINTTDPDALFELIGTNQAIYTDFVFGAQTGIVSQDGSAGCGLVYRWQDERNLDLAYIDAAGGFGVVQSREAELARNAYDLSPMVTPDFNTLLVLARGDKVAFYVNGALVTQETVQPGAGRVGVALLNYEDVPADCFWTDLWVWPLLDAPPETDAAPDDTARTAPAFAG